MVTNGGRNATPSDEGSATDRHASAPADPTDDEELVRASYDAVAEQYAARFSDELRHKPLDRALLTAFVEQLPPGTRTVGDVGCGPGHATRHLSLLGVHAVGTDLSSGMVAVAKRLQPDLDFRVCSLLHLYPEDGAWAGIVALYSIIHLSSAQLAAALREFLRVLRVGGLLLVSFHAGHEVRHVEEFLDRRVSLDFRFFEMCDVADAIRAAGFQILMTLQRPAYQPHEVDTLRAYILARKPYPEV